MLFQNEADALKKSSWPSCDRLAEDLAGRGPAAADALVYASRSRTHHVRSASLKALTKVSPEKAKDLAEKMLSDKAYEARETAAKILGVPVPQ